MFRSNSFAFALGVLAVAALGSIGTALAAPAASLTLSSDDFWAVLASSEDIDQAVGVARALNANGAKVVHATNGRYAVITGPHKVAPGTGQAFIAALIKDKHAPKDAYLTKGARFDAVAWTEPPTGVVATLEFDGEKDVSMQRGRLALRLSRKKLGEDEYAPTLTGSIDGRKVFAAEITENGRSAPAAKIDIVRLDPRSPQEQIVFSYFWMGAHCCTVTEIVTQMPGGAWTVVDAGVIDGEGYALERQSDASYSELVSIDQPFLYAFTGYAGSFAPIRIQRLEGTNLVDVTRDSDERHRVLQDIARTEYFASSSASGDDNLLGSAGYLAGWVADNFLAGRGEAAWHTMLATWDHEEPMFGPERCTISVPVDKCPEAKKVKLPFPEGLRQFLTEHGYIADPARFSIGDSPQPVESPSQSTDAAGTPARLRSCTSAADTLRRLIWETFAGRKTSVGDLVQEVALAGDTTLEAYDPALAKATCAVTYTLPLKPLIAQLKAQGDSARAEKLGRLVLRSGPTASHRVIYTVKPTATVGSALVELMK